MRFAAIDVLAPIVHPGYHSYTSQMVSELFGLGAPTRALTHEDFVGRPDTHDEAHRYAESGAKKASVDISLGPWGTTGHMPSRESRGHRTSPTGTT